MASTPRVRRRQSSSKSDKTGSTTGELFEQTFAVVDSAVTAALISGVAPSSMRAVLSYAFQNVAARARFRLSEFEIWLTDPDLVWEPVLSKSLTFVKNFDGPLKEESLQELRDLREECGIKDFELSEIEDRRHGKTTFSLIAWLLKTLDEQGHDLYFVECAMFLEWIKVSALIGDCGERNYLIVRQNMPAMAECWDEFLRTA